MLKISGINAEIAKPNRRKASRVGINGDKDLKYAGTGPILWKAKNIRALVNMSV